MSEELICQNENCSKAFVPMYEGQLYCQKKCKRSRVMRRNRGKKNANVYSSRIADIKICQHCQKVIQRGPKTPDHQWEMQKYHRKCYVGIHTIA